MKNVLKSEESRNLNEIVFENRNKMYGAYALRREESSVMQKSMLLGISLFLGLAITPIIISSFQTTVPDLTGINEPPVWIVPPELEKKKMKPDPPAATPPVQKPVATFNSAVPTPTKTAVDKPAATVKREEAIAGFRDTAGEKPTVTYIPPVINPGPVSVTPVTPVAQVPAKDPNAVEKEVDIQADFSGGLDAFRKKVGQSFNTADYDGSGERISATVTFIVEKDGSISGVTAAGPDVSFNKEAEKTVKSVKGTWKPAVLDGQKVRSYFRIPITMQFD